MVPLMELWELMQNVVDARIGMAIMIEKIEKFYSLQSLPCKVLMFTVGVVGVYALANLVLSPIYELGQKFGATLYNKLF